jgi:primosomal protein N'
MYILEIMPLTKSIKVEHLSYFSSKDIEIGSLVTIEIRKKNVFGIVLNKTQALENKEDLKSKNFSLKKIKSVHKNTILQNQFIAACQKTADYFATSTGAVVNSLVPKKIFENIKEINNPKIQIENQSLNEQSEKYVIQDQFDERYASYKSLVRESFAKNNSVIFICPTSEDIERTKKLISKGIEDHTFTFNSAMTKNQLVKSWNDVIENVRPVLIICTGNFISIPRHDIGTIIIEQESSNAYRIQQMPYIDIRTFAENYTAIIGARLFLGDIALRSETLARYDTHEFLEEGTLKFRALSTAESKIIDMKKHDSNNNDMFSILSKETMQTLSEARHENELTFIFTARRGLAPSIICSDCGTIVTCKSCSAPIVLYGKDPSQGGNIFQCHICGDVRRAGEKCVHCDSWKLKMLGIGVETVAEKIKEKFPEMNIFILDSQHAKTSKQAREIISEFYNKPGSVLIGTEMALHYMRDPIENVLVASIDSLFSIPDYSIRERILRTLLRLRSKATKKFQISTRQTNDSLFENARQGNLADFYRNEFCDRKKYGYPPFVKLIKISVTGTPKAAEKAILDAKNYIEPYDLLVYPAFTERQKGKMIWHGILKIDSKKWPDEILKKKLLSLPPQFKIVVDAPSVL